MFIRIGFGIEDSTRKTRNKGRSIIGFPDNYVVVDIETTGLSTEFDSIIEIGAIRICNNQIVDSFQTFVKYDDELPEFIVELTGITDEMLVDAPAPCDAIREFRNYLGNDTVVGYNVSFDINFLYDYMLEYLRVDFANDYIDCMRIARKLFPDEKHHRLKDMIKLFNIQTDKSHRAVADCETTNAVFMKLREIVEEQSIDIQSLFRSSSGKPFEYTDETKALRELSFTIKRMMGDGKLSDEELYELEKWLKENDFLAGNYPYDMLYVALTNALEDGIITEEERANLQKLLSEYADPVSSHRTDDISEISGKNICLTGDFDLCKKKEFAEKLQARGAIIKTSVSKKTDYLIVGGKGSKHWSCGNYGGKVKDAIELQEKGAAIKIIREEDAYKFFELDMNVFIHRITESTHKILSESEKPDNLVSFVQNKDDSVSAWIMEPLSKTKSKLICKIEFKENHYAYISVMIKKTALNELTLPESAEIKMINSSPENVFILFNDELSAISFLETLVCTAITDFKPSEKFGCCHLYKECSDAKKCLHPDQFYSLACWYRMNLENGKIFY